MPSLIDSLSNAGLDALQPILLIFIHKKDNVQTLLKSPCIRSLFLSLSVCGLCLRLLRALTRARAGLARLLVSVNQALFYLGCYAVWSDIP